MTTKSDQSHYIEIEPKETSVLMENLHDVKDEVTSFIKKNPLTSVAIASAIGFYLGRLLSGRKE